MAEIISNLHFLGGPLDGSSCKQPVPAEWQVIRYEHVPRDDRRTVHVYSGKRQPEQREVQLQYIGSHVSQEQQG